MLAIRGTVIVTGRIGPRCPCGTHVTREEDVLIGSADRCKREQAAETKQRSLDYLDVAQDLDEPAKLKAAKEVLEDLQRIEALGYRVKIGVVDCYPAYGKNNRGLGVVIVFPRSATAHDTLTNEVLLKTS